MTKRKCQTQEKKSNGIVDQNVKKKKKDLKIYMAQKEIYDVSMVKKNTQERWICSFNFQMECKKIFSLPLIIDPCIFITTTSTTITTISSPEMLSIAHIDVHGFFFFFFYQVFWKNVSIEKWYTLTKHINTILLRISWNIIRSTFRD